MLYWIVMLITIALLVACTAIRIHRHGNLLPRYGAKGERELCITCLEGVFLLFPASFVFLWFVEAFESALVELGLRKPRVDYQDSEYGVELVEYPISSIFAEPGFAHLWPIVVIAFFVRVGVFLYQGALANGYKTGYRDGHKEGHEQGYLQGQEHEN